MNKEIFNKVMEENSLDALISFAPQTRLWATGVTTSEGLLFMENKITYIFVDSRYIEYVQANAQNAQVILYTKENVDKFISERADKYKKVGIEKEYITLAESEKIKTWFDDAEQVQVSAHEMRIIKTQDEIENIKEACDIALKALEATKQFIKPGVTEKYVDAKLEYYIRKFGAEKGSFDAIVASGVRGSLPHGRASEKVIEEGELLTIDFGAIVNGYCSDITRTLEVGKTTDPKLLEISQVLRQAQELGKAAVKPGATTKEIDETCRKFIESRGYGEYFVHSTGHGLGIDVHEKPNVTSNEALNVTLEPGMIITVEPGIYIPGLGGIRVEDDVLVTPEGRSVLSNYRTYTQEED